LKTWKRLGLPIYSIQLEKEVPEVEGVYRGVKILSTGKSGKEYGAKDTVRIKAITDLALRFKEPILFINSDVKIDSTKDQFRRDWIDYDEGAFRVGVRYDKDGKKPAKLNPYGIDAFRFTPEQAEKVKDIGYSVGTICWDYWIVWEMLRQGFEVSAKLTRGLTHQVHPNTHTRQDIDQGHDIFKRNYPISLRTLSLVVREETGRLKRSQVYRPTPRPTGNGRRATEIVDPAKYHLGADRVTPTSPRLVVMMAGGKKALEESKVSAPIVQKYAEEAGADFRVLRSNEVTGPHAKRFLIGNKWRVGAIAKHYKQTLLVDADVLIRPDAPDLFSLTPADQFGFFNELPYVLASDLVPYFDWSRSQICESQELPKLPYSASPNTGLFLIPGSLAALYGKPDRPWAAEHSVDQQYLAARILAEGVPHTYWSDELHAIGLDRDFAQKASTRPFVHFVGLDSPGERLRKLRKLAGTYPV